jgi:hypothetical protein
MLVMVVDSVVLYLHGPHKNVCCFRVADVKVSVWRVDILQGYLLGRRRLQDRRMRSRGVNVRMMMKQMQKTEGRLLRVQVWWGTAMRLNVGL